MKKSIKCPNCQIEPIGASKNIPLINIIEKYLESHPAKQKSLETKKKMDEINIFTNKYHEFKKEEPEQTPPNPPLNPLFPNFFRP